MASQSLISTVDSYENYIEKNGIDEQVINAYVDACSVAIEQNEDLERERMNTVLFTAQVTVTTNKSRSEALNVAQTVADEYKAMSFKLVPAPFARKNGKIWTATLRARRSFDWNDRL